MTSIFSAISGHFTRLLVLGTLLPTVAFGLLAVLVLGPLVTTDPILLAQLLSMATDWHGLAWTAGIVFLTGILYNANVPLIRLYEGYPWAKTFVGRRLSARHRRRVEEAARIYPRLACARARLARSEATLRPLVQTRLNELGHLLNERFPGSSLVLPTRLGNVIRSFEEYPRHQYSMSSIPLWPRLLATIDKDYGTAIDDAKTSLDFMLNCSFLAALLSAATVVAGLVGRRPFVTVEVTLAWMVVASCLAVFSYALYRGAVSRAIAWGGQVKGAFDLYRWELLAKLGYQQKPRTRREERDLWKAICRQIVYGDPFEGTPPDYAPPPPEGLLKRLGHLALRQPPRG
ncbi:MAG TPA: hypothetical protein VGK32_12945 [Vicinamibacterales bacterium]|jgi:hypothetical protein